MAQLTRQRILDAGRRLLAEGIYSQVTMEEIAREAGVAYQTLYAVFRTKLRLAEAIIAAGLPHIAAALQLLDDLRDCRDPEVWLTTLATMARRIFEPCADLDRFMRESGDPDLLARFREVQSIRHNRLLELRDLLAQSARRLPSLTADEAIDLVWALTGVDFYTQLVFDRGWTPDRYEAWLRDSLVSMVLQPN